MTITPVFHGRVDDEGHKLTLEDRGLYLAHLRRYAGRAVEVVVRLRKSKRSNEQNRWLWGVALELLVEDFGYERNERKKAKEDLHYRLVEVCFGMHWDAKLSMNVPNVRSSHLNTKEFSEYMEWLVRYAAEHYGVVIPLPNEVDMSAIPDDAEAA
jgi:hypothetical protein